MHVRTTAAAGAALLGMLVTAPGAAAHPPDPVTAEVTGTTLAIEGTGRDDAIGLAVRGDELRVKVRGRDPRVPLADFDRVTIAPGAGADRIEVGDLGDAAFEGVETDLGADADADEVTVTGSPGRDFASLSHFGATTFVLGLPTFSTIVNPGAGDALALDTAGGDDDVSAQSYPAEALALTLEGGGGDDDLFAGRGDDLILGGTGDDAALGGRGEDRARLGTGDDLFRWDPGDGSDAVAFQSGFDALTFVGEGAAERFDVQADDGDVRFTRDLGSIVMELSGAERIGAFLNSGGDRVTVGDLSGTGMTGSDWSFGALDDTPDVLRVDGTRRDDDIVVTQGGTNPAGTSTSATISGIPAPVLVTGVQPDDALEVNGLGGEDTIDASSIVPGAFSFSFSQ